MNLKAGKPWRELRDALLLGVAEDRDIDGKPLFVAPYVSQPENGVDVHGELVVTGENVNVRQAPDPRAAVIDRLSHDIVRAGPDNRFGSLQENDTPGKPSAWAQIITPAGKLGYVYGQFVRGPTNIRFHFKRIDGRWRIVYISAGD